MIISGIVKGIQGAFLFTKKKMRIMKDSTTDWILFLNSRQQNLMSRAERLEQEIEALRND